MADVAGLSAAIAGLAPLASPALSGTPTAPTPTTGDDSGKIATTAFVAATAEKYLPLDGGVLTGAVTFPLPTTNGASLNIPHGTEPTTLVDGDVWSTVAGLSMYINGTARTFFDDQNLLAATQIEAEAGSATAVRIWSSERIRQAILAAPIGAATQSALDGKVGVSGAQTVAGVKTFSDTAVFSTGATFSGKLSFGSTLVTAVNDLSKHIALWGSTYGLTVTENNLNFVSASAFQWAVGTSVKMTLTSAGDLTAVGNVTAYSDARLKSKVKTIENALDVVDQLRGVYFEMNNRRGMGLIAQELEAVIPELVFKGADEQQTRSVAYANLVALLIEAIKELRAEVNELKKGSV